MYYALHKTFELQRLVHGKSILVEPTNEERELIMKVRKGPLEGILHPEVLIARVERALLEVRMRQIVQDLAHNVMCDKDNIKGCESSYFRLIPEVSLEPLAKFLFDLRVSHWGAHSLCT